MYILTPEKTYTPKTQYYRGGIHEPIQHPGRVLSGLGVAPDDIDEHLRDLRKKLPNCGLFISLRMVFGFLPKQICTVTLGRTYAGRSVEAFFFPGRSEKRALVVSGVHGSELSGIEVAKRLVKSLHEDASMPPHFNVLVIPELFTDNAERARAANPPPGKDSNEGRTSPFARCPKSRKRGGDIVCADPNREFPPLSKPFDPDKPVDALKREIEAENVMLLNVVRLFRPSRIASVHAHSMPKDMKRNVDAPGIFADSHTVPPTATQLERLRAILRTARDCKLALDMARHAKGRGARVPGNWLDTRRPTCQYGSKASHQDGVSLGGWGPSLGITVVTLEVHHYYPSNAIGSPTARSKKHVSETGDRMKNRLKELLAHVAALRDVFLGPP
jgi:hypothetical protein